MSIPNDSGHVVDLLPAYLNGSLDPDENERVDRHLDGCPGCRAELVEWRAISEVSLATAGAIPPPSETVLERVRTRIEQPGTSMFPGHAPVLSFGAHYLWQLLIGQIPLVHRGIWIAAPVTLSAGCLVALTARQPEGSGMVLALIAPMVAAVTMALIYGPENDPSLELALSTATSPRRVLLARMTLVFGYDLMLALAATAVIAATVGGGGLWPLVVLWIGPMLFLSALALALSLVFGSAAAISAAVVLWIIRVYALTNPGRNQGATSEFAEMVNSFWSAGPLLVTLFICTTLVLLIAVPQRERFA